MPLPIYLFSKTPCEGVIHIPILRTEYLQPEIDMKAYDALVMTSKEAVDALEILGTDWKRLPLLCVGQKTAEYVRRHGGMVLDIGGGYGEDLESLIIKRYARKRWLYARPKMVASSFAARLREGGVSIDDVVLYETHCNPDVTETIAKDAVLLFTSPSTVRCFEVQYGFLPGHRVAVIGETTKAALPKGVKAQIPETPEVVALVALGRSMAGLNAEI